MVTFSFIKPPARGSLRRRRMADALRRLTAALCVGLAVLFGIEAVLAVVETEPMVVAARSIRRGDIILAADVQLADMPVSAAGPSWTGNIEDVVGKVAQIDIEAADPISTHMARDAPVAPTGTTVIEVRLASSVDDVLAGDQVRLVSAVGCEGADCTLAENATVMNVGKPDATGALGGNDRLVSFAMPPEPRPRLWSCNRPERLWPLCGRKRNRPSADTVFSAACRLRKTQCWGAQSAPQLLLALVKNGPMRRQFAEDAFVVVGLPLLVGLHVSGLEFDTVSVKLLSALHHHALVLARCAPCSRVFRHGYSTSR
mgnify:FL=1